MRDRRLDEMSLPIWGKRYKTFYGSNFKMPLICHSACPGNTKGGNITVLLTTCLTGLELAV
jgi:hypothetical protein